MRKNQKPHHKSQQAEDEREALLTIYSFQFIQQQIGRTTISTNFN